MSQNNGGVDAPAASRFDGHRLSEFIYGTVTGMVAVAGISGGHEASWSESALVIIAGAAAIWVAHAYSELIGKRVVSGHRADARDLGEALRGSWPIVSAGVILAIPLLPVAAGLWSLDFALGISSIDPALEGVGGKFIVDGKERRSSDHSYDQAKAQRLWEMSWDWCGLDESGPS